MELCWHEGCLCETRGVMISHHFIGTGVWSEALQRSQRDPAQLLAEVTGHARACHLQVMATQAVPFDEGGLTLVWVLAESHLVLHVWPELQSATLDLHVCNYSTSNAANARALRDRLAAVCFATGGTGQSWWLARARMRPPSAPSAPPLDRRLVHAQLGRSL